MRTTPRMGLTSWDQPDDFYNYAQLAGNWQIVDFHDHSPGKGVPVSAGGIAPGAVLSQNIAAGVVGAQHLDTALIEDLGLNGGGITGRGVFIQAASGQISSATAGALTNGPDAVSGITLTTNGIITVDFQANWVVSTTATTSAAIYLNGTELVGPTSGSTAASGATTTTSTIYTNGSGLQNTAGTATGVTTGVVVGTGSVDIFAAAGTYTVAVQYSTSTGTLTVSNRRLYVRTINFA